MTYAEMISRAAIEALPHYLAGCGGDQVEAARKAREAALALYSDLVESGAVDPAEITRPRIEGGSP